MVLTFDDSAKSHYTVVRPLLKEYGFGATFFITEGFDFKVNKKDYVTWEQITKLHEEVRRGPLDELAVLAAGEPNLQRGEFVVVVSPPAVRPGDPSADDLDSALAKALKSMRIKDAAEAVAGALGLPRRVVYARALELKDDG